MTDRDGQAGPEGSAASLAAETVRRDARSATLRALSAARTPEALAEAGRHALEIAETAFDELRDSDEAVRREIAGLHCRKYCAHCCYKTVSATPAEVINLARVIQATFKPKALAKLKARLAALESKTRDMSPEARGRAQLPCALLVGRLCTAHSARPAACRGFNSRDVSACERSRKRRDVKIPVYAPQYRIFGAAHLGLREGLGEAGLGSGHLELTAALRIALDAPDAAERYLGGEPVFRDAEQT